MASGSGAVLLIGAGRMGGALIKGWLAAKSFTTIHVVEPQASGSIRAFYAAPGTNRPHTPPSNPFQLCRIVM